jgi:competence transcription factor ComK
VNTTFFVGCLCVFFERINQKKKGGEFFISYACLKKKKCAATEKNSSVVCLFRVFEQKKKRVCRFLNPDLASRDTGTRRHTGHKRKKRTTITTTTTTTRNNNTNEKSKSE